MIYLYKLFWIAYTLRIYCTPGMQRLCDKGLEGHGECRCRDIQTDGMMTTAIKSVIVPILYCMCHNTLVMSVLLHHIGHCA